jgi:hypothetical protein
MVKKKLNELQLLKISNALMQKELYLKQVEVELVKLEANITKILKEFGLEEGVPYKLDAKTGIITIEKK